MGPTAFARVPRAIIFISVLFAAIPVVRADMITMTQGQVVSLQLDVVANTVAVGDIKIADARVAFDNTLVVVGNEVGVTNIIVFDDNGIEVYSAPIAVTTSALNQSVSIIGSGQRRSLVCGPGRCEEPREPDQIIQSETTVDNEAASTGAATRTTQQTF